MRTRQIFSDCPEQVACNQQGGHLFGNGRVNDPDKSGAAGGLQLVPQGQ